MKDLQVDDCNARAPENCEEGPYSLCRKIDLHADGTCFGEYWGAPAG